MRRRQPLAVAGLLAALMLTACGGHHPSTTDAAISTPHPMATPSPSSTPTRSAAAVHCRVVEPMQRQVQQTRVRAGTCLSFDGYSDIQAVIDTVRSTRPSVVRQLDPLTFRAAGVGTAVLVVRSTREICTASATCVVHNPPQRIRVTVRG
jgi:hypothetical protein